VFSERNWIISLWALPRNQNKQADSGTRDHNRHSRSWQDALHITSTENTSQTFCLKWIG
jgi:hypothetical protein